MGKYITIKTKKGLVRINREYFLANTKNITTDKLNNLIVNTNERNS